MPRPPPPIRHQSTDADATVLDHARRDLAEAVRVAVARDGHLLSAGEAHVARSWLALPHEVASLYARLCSRRRRLFPLVSLDYTEVPDVQAAAQSLIDGGFAWNGAAVAPASWLTEGWRAPELRAACRALGRPTGGRRADLEARLADDGARQVLVQPSIVLRHRPLFRRLARLYLHDHQGDLSRLVVARMGLIQYPEYAVTGGAGLFPTRRSLLDYESALQLRATLEPMDCAAKLPDLLEQIARLPSPNPIQRRFSARRFLEQLALDGAQALERTGNLRGAEDAYRSLLRHGTGYPGRTTLRLAMVLGRSQRPAEAVTLCAHPDATHDPTERLGLARTGRRLARAARVEWVPQPPLLAAPIRSLQLQTNGTSARNRPQWRVDRRGFDIESALCAVLARRGRRAFQVESAPWRTVFGLVLRPALFAPVSGALPSAMLTAPLDLRTPLFAARRQRWLGPLMDRVRAGHAPSMLREAYAKHFGEAIAGVDWATMSVDALETFCAAVGGPALAAVLDAFSADWRGAGRGLPDLCILPGDACALPGPSAGLLPKGLLLAEVKGPTDSLRDAQRVWHDRLQRAGVRVELWKVKPFAPPASG